MYPQGKRWRTHTYPSNAPCDLYFCTRSTTTTPCRAIPHFRGKGTSIVVATDIQDLRRFHLYGQAMLQVSSGADFGSQASPHRPATAKAHSPRPERAVQAGVCRLCTERVLRSSLPLNTRTRAKLEVLRIPLTLKFNHIHRYALQLCSAPLLSSSVNLLSHDLIRALSQQASAIHPATLPVQSGAHPKYYIYNSF